MPRDDAADATELDVMAAELKELRSEHQRLRLDLERATRRLAETERDRAELTELRGRVTQLEALEVEVIDLREHERTLEAQVFSLGCHPSTRPAPVPLAPAASGTYADDIERRLETMVRTLGLRGAAVADSQGLLVAYAGDSLAQEGLTAYSALASELSARVRSHLPLAAAEMVRITDTNHVTLACRLFQAGGEEYGLTVIGSGDFDWASASEVVEVLASALSAGRASVSGA